KLLIGSKIQSERLNFSAYRSTFSLNVDLS
ncbi:unnamed protein product, partial [marine sediment metagenome]